MPPVLNTYDIVVIGGGHAGSEAAWAAAHMGCRTALVTMSADAIGRMSCNPAIGGLGKGQIVREIDALGGLMALASDAGGIQFRMLNRSKGPAVWAPRAQADRSLYAAAVQGLLRSTPDLDIIEGLAERLLTDGAGASESGVASQRESGGAGERKSERAGAGEEGDRDLKSQIPADLRFQIRGVRLHDGRELRCRAMILTTGTFLRGLMHCGERKTEGGRIGEAASVTLSDELRRLGFTLGRLKTGTPPRIHRDSINYAQLETQPGDDPPIPFSFLTPAIAQPQVECWITHTNERTHEAIRANLHRAPMYSGQIQSRGPRYCPSIEDKVMRFADKASHQIFLEPEGYDNAWIYCNGISTSLPPDVQDAVVHSIAGLEGARIVQYGYAVEYDWAPTDQISATLETKRVAGLFHAGQINGTSGYEEAAGQGLIAGINAAAQVLGREPVVLGRDAAYIGVMIDDLVTRPPDEPYRMFTSRAEYRLHLRSDNADLRLTQIGRRVGLVDDTRWTAFERKREAIAALEAALAAARVDGQSALERLRRPEIRVADLLLSMSAANSDGSGVTPTFSSDVLQAVEIRAKYAGYLDREQRQIERHRQLESRLIPESFNYAAIPELRYEAREKFARFRPLNVGQAARISGISPADIATLSLHLFRR
jgi:tRNA uridine 5-carboxymethylaminomethyl modification enzyme